MTQNYCGTCRFYEPQMPDPVHGDFRLGDCRIDAPGRGKNVWPTVGPEMWCGRRPGRRGPDHGRAHGRRG